MRGYHQLLEYEDHWPTQMGAWFPQEGKVVYRGKEIFKDFKYISWMKLLLYGITGRMFNENAIKLFEAIWVLAISYPEPRLWANRIAALAGTARSTGVLGVGAAITACEGVKVGHRANIRCIDFFLRAQKKLDSGMSLDAIIAVEMEKYRGIAGFGRPVEPQKDERVEPLMEVVRHLGFAEGKYLQLAFQVEQALLQSGQKRLGMNISGLAAALAADRGLKPREYYHYLIQSFTAGIMPCYVDALEKPEGCFFPLRCDRIQYEGHAQRRKW